MQSRWWSGLLLALAGLGGCRGSSSLEVASGRNVTFDLHACWVLDGGARMADTMVQLRDSHVLLLQHSSASPQGLLPEGVAVRLEESSRRLNVFLEWLNEAAQGLREHLSAGSLRSETAEALLSPKTLLEQLTPSEVAAAAWSSSSSWSKHCPEDVLVEPFLGALGVLRAQLGQVDGDIAQQASRVFALRSERVAVAGELEALESLLQIGPTTARKASVAGLHNVSRDLDRALWRDESLRKQTAVMLARAMQDAGQRVAKEHGGGAGLGSSASGDLATLDSRRDEAAVRLNSTDRALLEGGLTLRASLEARHELTEKMKNHLKSMLAQCLPRAKDAAKSRYARFQSSSPASNAVQLVMEASDLLNRSLLETIPSMLQSLQEGWRGDDRKAEGTTDFRSAPSMARWWEWIPDPASGAGPFLGFDEFMDHYQRAVKEYDHHLAAGGHLVALHSMLLRWEGALTSASAGGSPTQRGAISQV